MPRRLSQRNWETYLRQSMRLQAPAHNQCTSKSWRSPPVVQRSCVAPTIHHLHLNHSRHPTCNDPSLIVGMFAVTEGSASDRAIPPAGLAGKGTGLSFSGLTFYLFAFEFAVRLFRGPSKRTFFQAPWP